MIQDNLKKMGLNDKEIEVYLAIVAQGKASHADLAKTTGINRTTIYSIAKELVKKGFAREDLAGKKSYLLVRPDEDLEKMIATEERHLAEKKKVIDETIKEIAAMARVAEYSIPKITFITEEDLLDTLYERTPIWVKSSMKYDKTWWGFQDHTFAEFAEKWIDWFWPQVPKDMKVKLLTNKSDIEESIKGKKYKQRIMKYWTGGNEFTASMTVQGSMVTFFMTRQHPYYMIEIYDRLIAENLRSLFTELWKMVEVKEKK